MKFVIIIISMVLVNAVTFVMVLATAVTWPIQQLLNKFGIGYLQTVVFILVIAALVQLVEMFMKKSMPALYKSLGIFLPLITTNCAVLGVCITNIDSSYNYLESLVNAFGAGIGFLFAMVVMAGVRTKLVDQSRIPESFRGVPIVLITAKEEEDEYCYTCSTRCHRRSSCFRYAQLCIQGVRGPGGPAVP